MQYLLTVPQIFTSNPNVYWENRPQLGTMIVHRSCKFTALLTRVP